MGSFNQGYTVENLEYLKNQIFETDNHACFIERERILSRLVDEMADYTESDRYAKMLETILSEVSTPIDSHDYFVGRVLEAVPDNGMVAPNLTLSSLGHMSFDYAKVLNKLALMVDINF